ncbi:MAG: efflux RND transporter periplasmic adaptor subunit [Alphaproteobacteria bacterium]|nr:efflux RND transporter periplasmic adaptor subunit [Alphaproteobacteria bacterium]
MNRFFFLVFLSSCIAFPAFAEDALFVVKRQAVDDRKAVIATVESVREVLARARIGGTITALLVKEGDPVAANDKIAVIGDQKLAIRGKGFEARIQAARSSYEKAKLDFARAEDLRKTGYGTQAKLDEAKNNLEVAANNLRVSEAEYQGVAQETSEGSVLAPSAGRVLRVPVAVGSVVMPGETIATLSQENYVLRLELPERHARFLKPGDAVFIGARGLQDNPDEVLKKGTVRLVYPAIKDGRVMADVMVPDMDNYFVGERTLVYVSTGQRQAFLVPSDYVFHHFGISFVRLKGGEEIVVQTGQKNEDQVEILSGLSEGDEVMKP